MKKIALVLSGGGARGAYQAGVMRALTEILESEKQRVSIITGASAGAINAAFLASHWENPREAANKLATLWQNLHAEHVYRTDALSVGRIGLKWLLDTTFGSLTSKKMARSLLNTNPLRDLLAENVSSEAITKNLANKELEALALTAMDYASGTSVSFVQSGGPLPMWDRFRRRGEQVGINVEHIMGSSAIPLFFPPIGIGDRFFGDGCVRNSAPLSPAIHLGGDKLIVVSVRRPDTTELTIDENYEPTIARVLGVIMNALLLDSIDLDMERMIRINNTLEHVPQTTLPNMSLRKLNYLWLRPSQDLGHLAVGQFDKLPPVIRYMVGGLGSSTEASEITSYLLFEPEFCGKLVELGYQDGLTQAEQIRTFISD